MGLTEAVNPLTRVGLAIQLSAAILLGLLFVVLGRQAPGRRYFVAWTRSWMFLAVAFLALFIRFDVIAALPEATFAFEGQPSVRLLYLLYQLGKVWGIALIVEGALRVRRPGRELPVTWAAIGLGTYAAVSVIASPRFEFQLIWQAVVLVPLFAIGAWALLGRCERLSSLGPRLTGGLLATLAALWAAYGIDYARAIGAISHGIEPHVLRVLGTLNPFIDSVGMLLLGYGMVLVLMEDLRVEASEARAAHQRDVAASERRLAGIISSARDAIVTLDGETRITLANPAAEQMFGYGLAQLTGRRINELIPDVTPPMLRTAAGTAPFSDRLVVPRFQLSGRRVGMPDFPLELSVASLDTPGGEGWILVIGDITQRRQYERERETLRERLAHSQKMEAVGRLVSGVAHELNNPLAAILTFSESLLHDHRPAGDREGLEAIREQAQRSRTIVRDLLAFVGRREERRESLAPGPLLERVVRGVAPELARHGAVLHTDIPADLPTIEVDAAGLEQVVTNLISNAAHAAGRGGKVVLGARAGHFDALEIVVSDTGPGIPPDVFPRLYEPFFTTKAPGEGTGLGLSVSLGIVEHHGGTIRAENARDGGARFVVTLPRGVRGSPAPLRLVAGAGADASLPTDHGRSRVLLVEDEQPVRLALRR
ncbi:MAG TPA: ATP-binding protein, partial [Gemmatimonadales bacterium]|nr:ATP-binding protein [Gemmatimonadales bacterium]